MTALASQAFERNRRVIVIVGDYSRLREGLRFLGPVEVVEAVRGARGGASAIPDEWRGGPLGELARLALAGDDARLRQALEDLRGRVPLVEPDPEHAGRSVVTFVYLAADDSVHAVTLPQLRHGPIPLARRGSAAPQPPRSLEVPFSRLPGTRLWSLRLNMPDDTLLGYSIGVVRQTSSGTEPEAREDVLDPFNPHTAFSRGTLSVLRLPKAPAQRWLEAGPTTPRGRVEAATVVSRFLGETRNVTVYVPASPGPARRTRVVFVFDGEYFTSELAAATVLDNLIHERQIPPTVAVFVDGQASRDQDLVNNPAFARFVAEELHPWAVSRYGVSRRPGDAALAGASFGGLAAAYIARLYPNRFGHVISLSGAFWPPAGWSYRSQAWEILEHGSALIETYVRGPRVPVRFFLDVGLYEPSMLIANRRLRDVLRAGGYVVSYREHPGGHDGLWWRTSIGDGLIATFGRP